MFDSILLEIAAIRIRQRRILTALIEKCQCSDRRVSR
jgi:hypothetical protein